ncbi:unnamed protein product, partial [marine sediment metagenome]
YPISRELAGLNSQMGHGIYWVGDHNDDALRRVVHHIVGDLGDDFHISQQ